MNHVSDSSPQTTSDSDAIADREQLLGLINAQWTTHAIAAAVRLGLPEAMGAGPVDADALAQASQTHPPSLRRLLQALTSLGLCEELAGGRFALTATGSLLRADIPNSLHAWASLNGGRISTQWPRLDEAVRSGTQDDFSHLDDDPEAAALFNRAMVELTAPIAAALVRVIDLRGARQVVDVGGGHGELLASVLQAYPALKGELFDMAHATQSAAGRIDAAGLADRCERVTGSFFDAIPQGADVYLLKSILHDWDDARCVRILQTCRRAMAPDARLLILERIASEKISTSPQDRAVAGSDLLMMVANGGCERSESAYRALVGAAGLRIARIDSLTGGFSVMTAVGAKDQAECGNESARVAIELIAACARPVWARGQKDPNRVKTPFRRACRQRRPASAPAPGWPTLRCKSRVGRS
jgi:orsellinic acid C2-O-methyltransferase